MFACMPTKIIVFIVFVFILFHCFTKHMVFYNPYETDKSFKEELLEELFEHGILITIYVILGAITVFLCK